MSTTSSSHSPVSQRETRSVFTSSGLKIHECIPTNSSMATQEPSQASQTILLSSSPRLPPAALLSSSPPSGDPVVRARSPPSRASNRPHPLKSPATVCISDLQRIAGTLQGRLSSATRRVRSDGSLYQRPHGTPVMAYRHSSTSILHSQAGPSALPHKPRTERYQCQNPSPAAHPATPFLHLVPEETYNVGLPQFASFTSGCGIPEKVGTRHSTRKCAECVAYRAEAWFAIDRSQGYERYLELYGDNIPKGLTLLQRRMLKQWKEKRKHDKHLQQEGDDVHQYGDGKRATAAELRAAQLVTPANQQRPSGFSLVSSPSSGLAEGSAVNDSANMLPGAHLQVQRPTAELRTCLRQRHEHLPRQPVRVGDVNMVASEFDIALHGFPVSNARTEEQMAALYRNVDPVEGFTNPYRLPKNKDAGHIASGLLPLLQQLQPSTRAESVGVDVIPLQLPRPTPGPLPYAFDVSYHGGPHSQRHYRPFLHAASASLTLSRAIPMNISTTVNQPSNNAGVMVGQPEPRPPPHTWTAPGDPSEQSFASDYSTSSSTDVDPDSTIRITVPGSYVCGPEDGGSNGNLRVSQGPTRLPDLFVNLRAIPSTGGTCGPNANSAAGAGTGRAVRRRPLPSRGGRVHQRPPLRKIAPRPTGVIKTTAGGTVKQDRSFLRPDPAGTVGVSAAYAGRISTDASHVQTLGYINNAPTQPDYTGRGGDNCRVNAQQVLDSSSSETTEDDSRDNTDGTVDTLCVALATSSAATAGFATSREVVLATTMRGAPNTGGTEEPQATTLAPFDVDWDSDIDADSESGPDTQQKSLVTKSRDKKRKEPPSPRAGPTVTTTATKSFSDGNVHAVYSTDCRKIRAVASGP